MRRDAGDTPLAMEAGVPTRRNPSPRMKLLNAYPTSVCVVAGGIGVLKGRRSLHPKRVGVGAPKEQPSNGLLKIHCKAHKMMRRSAEGSSDREEQTGKASQMITGMMGIEMSNDQAVSKPHLSYVIPPVP